MALRTPKQRVLTENETLTTFEAWRENLVYALSQDPLFAPYLAPDARWEKRGRNNPRRGFQDDPQANNPRLTAAQKVVNLELMLGQVANYAPVISRGQIVKESTSIGSVWDALRLHYGYQNTGAHFLQLANFKLEVGERPETLFQRIRSFVEDNLLTRNGGIHHHGAAPIEDEEITPTVENFITLIWLKLINNDLPNLVTQRYGTDLRSKTLASLRPVICQVLPSLLSELQVAEEVKTFRLDTRSGGNRPRNNYQGQSRLRPQPARNRFSPTCPLCEQAGRNKTDHYLLKCPFLPENERSFLTRSRTRTRLVEIDIDDEEDPYLCSGEDDKEETPSGACAVVTIPTNISRVKVQRSPLLNLYFGQHCISLLIDSGAESNLIEYNLARKIRATIYPNTEQHPSQADGVSRLKVKGEVHLRLHGHNKEFLFDALVVDQIGTPVIAGVPFLAENGIDISMRNKCLILAGGESVPFAAPSGHHNTTPATRLVQTQTTILRGPDRPTTVWPGEVLTIEAPSTVSDGEWCMLEPRFDTNAKRSISESLLWPAPTVVMATESKLNIPNTTSYPVILRAGDHLGNIFKTTDYTSADIQGPSVSSMDRSPEVRTDIRCDSTASTSLPSDQVRVDPDCILPANIRGKLRRLCLDYDEVFKKDLSGYNGKSGPFEAKVNMGPTLPPQRKGRLPQYSRNKLVDLQHKFDELENEGVFARPEDLGISVEYVNPSFLVKKPNGTDRLVTAFNEVGKYTKPQPSLMPDVAATLRQIAQWEYIALTDLSSAYFQIPLSRESLKFCGVVTPFKGMRVYTKCAMGMPGSESALEELMSRILGDMIMDGKLAKIADDLYCGGQTPMELYNNLHELLSRLHANNLHLSPNKTIISPRSAGVLGWIWTNGRLSASPHIKNTLATCARPDTLTGLRSFVGSIKALSKVLPRCASFVGPLDDLIAESKPGNKLSWSDSQADAFSTCQSSLSTCKEITLPRANDTLWIVTDAASTHQGIGATLYVERAGKLSPGGYFSAKLRKYQRTWLPCELEALAIGSAVKHYSPFIIQSTKTTTVLTDNRPCVQAYEKLQRGAFSASPRVATFLSTLSQYQITLLHLAGKHNILSDFHSRNAPECEDSTCQICSFIGTMADSPVIMRVDGSSQEKLYAGRPTWIKIQGDDRELRRVKAHLYQGTRPSRKVNDAKNIKRYLQHVQLASDGLVIVRQEAPFTAPKQLIVVPSTILPGLLMSIHLQMSHPSTNQLKLIFKRSFYALDLDKAAQTCTTCCHQCASLQSCPPRFVPQSSDTPPPQMALNFAADVLRANRQCILVCREVISSFTSCVIIPSETGMDLLNGLIQIMAPLSLQSGPPAVVRTDPAPGFRSISRNEEALAQINVRLEIGEPKNINKNPVGERAIQEVHQELSRIDPRRPPVTPHVLALATRSLNAKIRSRGLSSAEMWHSRDQFTGESLQIDVQQLIADQQISRQQNHGSSATSKARGQPPSSIPALKVGDIVYLWSDKTKTHGRDRYIVTKVDHTWCYIQKFIGNQLRSASYKVRQSDCFKVPSFENNTRTPPLDLPEEDEPDATADAASDQLVGDTLVTDTPSFDSPVTDAGLCPDNTHFSTPGRTRPVPQPGNAPTPKPAQAGRPQRSADIPGRYRDFIVSIPGRKGAASQRSPQGEPDPRPRREAKLPGRYKDFIVYNSIYSNACPLRFGHKPH